MAVPSVTGFAASFIPYLSESSYFSEGSILAPFALVPQMLFFVWFVPVVLIWFHQSVFVWRKSYPLFRIGIWLGLGASSGIYLGSILAFNSF